MSDTTSTRKKDTASQKLRLLRAGLLFGALACPAFGVAQMQPHFAASKLPPQVLSEKLDTLRAWSARLYNLEDGIKAGYNTLINNTLTASDGCVSLSGAGGMGYHYTIAREDGTLPLLDDGEVRLLEPELLIYFPRGVTQEEFNAMTPEERTSHMKLVGFDYFIPYDFAPSPEDGGEPPTFEELGGLPFMPSRFGGWMLHIWLWRDNPAGMFSNWNPAVPTCPDSPF